MNSVNYFETVINWYLSAGGVMVSDEHYQARLDICKPCPKAGEVSLPFGLKTPGCTECGCSFATKPRVDRYMHPLEFKIKTVSCPLNKWIETDKKFKSN